MKILARLLSAGATLAAVGALSLGVISTASADGTRAGTTVNNTANLTYLPLPDLTGLAAGELPDLTAIAPVNTLSNTTTFLVDRKIDLEVLQATGGPVPVQQGGPGTGFRYSAPFTIENQGNADDIYGFTITPVPNDDFDFQTDLELYSDVDGNGEFTLGVDVLLATFDAATGVTTRALNLAAPIGADPANNLPDLLPPSGVTVPPGPAPTGVCDDTTQAGLDCPHQTANATFNLVLVTEEGVAVDPTVADGAFARYQVLAESVVDTVATAAATVEDTDGNDEATGNEVVFADGDDDSTNDVIVEDITQPEAGDDADHATFVVQAAEFTFTKAQEIICDPINGFALDAANPDGAYHIPGAYIRYTITVTNGGSAAALLTALTDNLQQDLRFDGNLIDPDQTGAENCSSAGATEEAGGVNIRTEGPAGVIYYTALAVPPAALPDPADLANADPTTVGPFLVSPSTAVNATDENGNPVTAGETITYLAVAPGGPLGPTAAEPARVPGQLNAGETITIQFNAILR